MKNKKIESLSTKAKKKKDALIVFGIVAILTILVASFLSQVLSANKKQVFENRKNNKALKKDIELINNGELKESWATKTDLALKEITNQLKDIKRQVRTSSEKTKEDVQESVLSIAGQIKDSTDAQVDAIKVDNMKFKKEISDKIEKQNQKIDRVISSLKSGGNVNINIKDVSASNKDQANNNDNLDNLVPNIDINSSASVSKVNGTIVLPSFNDLNRTKQNNKNNGIDILNNNRVTEQNARDNSVINDNKLRRTQNNPIVVETRKAKMVNLDVSKNKIYLKQSLAKAQKEKAKILAKKKLDKAKNTTYHIMTGVAKARLITGVYAPAFTAGDLEPVPVLLQTEGNILIANDDKENIDGCFLIGTAKGNMSSKTAMIRIVKISCSLNGGTKKIEGNIKGTVIGGESGIPGVRGDLLYQNGAFISKTFLAGFLDTFANAFSGLGRKASNANKGSVDFGSATQSAIGGGASKVFSKIGDYYLKMAEQIFPVIEVKPGVEVNIFFHGMEDVKVTDYQRADISEIEENNQKINNLQKAVDSFEEKDIVNVDKYGYPIQNIIENMDSDNNTAVNSDKQKNKPIKNNKNIDPLLNAIEQEK